MKIIDIVSAINQRMNFDNFEYLELKGSLDEAIDYINRMWRLDLPIITELPLMTQQVDEVTGAPIQDYLVPTEYTNMPDDMIRGYLIPFVAGQQYITSGQDGTPEGNTALINLGKLSERYGQTKDGATTISKPNFRLLHEDTRDQFATGNSNYNYSVSNDPWDWSK